MRDRGRNVIPWLHTCFLISLIITMSLVLLIDLVIFNGQFRNAHMSEKNFLIIYLIVQISIFFLLKRYYFDAGRHIKLSGEYLKLYSAEKRTFFKTISIIICLLIPFLLGFIIWYKAAQ